MRRCIARVLGIGLVVERCNEFTEQMGYGCSSELAGFVLYVYFIYHSICARYQESFRVYNTVTRIRYTTEA